LHRRLCAASGESETLPVRALTTSAASCVETLDVVEDDGRAPLVRDRLLQGLLELVVERLGLRAECGASGSDTTGSS
jgi:hypothetical protein